MDTLISRSSKCHLSDRLEILEEFDTLFRKYAKESSDEEMREIYTNAIAWCAKKRLELIKKLI